MIARRIEFASLIGMGPAELLLDLVHFAVLVAVGLERGGSMQARWGWSTPAVGTALITKQLYGVVGAQVGAFVDFEVCFLALSAAVPGLGWFAC